MPLSIILIFLGWVGGFKKYITTKLIVQSFAGTRHISNKDYGIMTIISYNRPGIVCSA